MVNRYAYAIFAAFFMTAKAQDWSDIGLFRARCEGR